MDATFDGYSTLNKNGIPDIPCIDAYQFANNIRNGQHIVNYTGHLLSASEKDYNIIGYVVCALGYNIKFIESFNYGTIKDNNYCYFVIEA